MNSLKKKGRLTGLLWLTGAAASGFCLIYVRPTILVPGSAAVTTSNILAFEPLFRMGIASMIVSQILLIFFGLAIFQIFQDVNKTLSSICLISLTVGGAIGIVNSLSSIAAVTLVTNPEYARAFQPEQLNALALTFLRVGDYGVGFVEVFTSIFLFCFGLLVLKSKSMPFIIGILLVVGSIGFPINTFTKILVPQLFPAAFTQLAMLGGTVGGAIPMLWLLIMGINEPRPMPGTHSSGSTD